MPLTVSVLTAQLSDHYLWASYRLHPKDQSPLGLLAVCRWPLPGSERLPHLHQLALMRESPQMC